MRRDDEAWIDLTPPGHRVVMRRGLDTVRSPMECLGAASDLGSAHGSAHGSALGSAHRSALDPPLDPPLDLPMDLIDVLLLFGRLLIGSVAPLWSNASQRIYNPLSHPHTHLCAPGISPMAPPPTTCLTGSRSPCPTHGRSSGTCR